MKKYISNFNFLFLDDKNGKEMLENSLSDKKKEATMDFAANIEKVREVTMNYTRETQKLILKYVTVWLVLGCADV